MTMSFLEAILYILLFRVTSNTLWYNPSEYRYRAPTNHILSWHKWRNLHHLKQSDYAQSLNHALLLPSRRSRELSLTQDRSKTACRTEFTDVPCSPPFRNIAQHMPVTSTSTCGAGQTLCQQDGHCQKCQTDSNGWRFTSDHLTDIDSDSNQTCWASSPKNEGDIDQSVNLTLSFGKRFEIYHVSLKTCKHGRLPDSIAIYKSSDFAKTWRPWHYFSTDCYKAFGLPTTDEQISQITTANIQEVLCVALQPRETYQREKAKTENHIYKKGYNESTTNIQSNVNLIKQSSNWFIRFSTIRGRPTTRPWSPLLVDWMTTTDIRISFMRFPSILQNEYRRKRMAAHPIRSWTPSSTYYGTNYWNPPSSYSTHPGHLYLPLPHPKNIRRATNSFRATRSSTTDEFKDLLIPKLHPSNTSEESTYAIAETNARLIPLTYDKKHTKSASEEALQFYAFSDLTVGGRCKCNGHANQCLSGPDGKLRCACEHNTGGDDCELCKEGYMDRPWARATLQNTNTCKKCDCNLHSEQCRFSNALYLMLNRVSGGICENCQHHTAGRNCQHCAEGYYRDWTKPVSHEKVCLPCRCHPIGSIVQHDCDRRSGQCRCKQGVTGMTCDRCQDGYHQTSSQQNPCTKDFIPKAVALAHTPTDIQCATCNANKERIKMKKFCRKDAVLLATFNAKEFHGRAVRFQMHIVEVWRLDEKALKHLKLFTQSNQANFNSTKRFNVWVRWIDLQCKCPDIQLGISYLIVTNLETYQHNNQPELRLSTNAAVLLWRQDWRRRLSRFKQKESRGECVGFRDSTRLKRHDQSMRPKQIVYGHNRWNYPYYSTGYGGGSMERYSPATTARAHRQRHWGLKQRWSNRL